MLDPSLWPEWAIEPLISPSQRARAKCLLDQDPLGLARVIRPWINRVEIGTQIARQLQSDRRAMHDGLTTVLNVAVAIAETTQGDKRDLVLLNVRMKAYEYVRRSCDELGFQERSARRRIWTAIRAPARPNYPRHRPLLDVDHLSIRAKLHARSCPARHFSTRSELVDAFTEVLIDMDLVMHWYERTAVMFRNWGDDPWPYRSLDQFDPLDVALSPVELWLENVAELSNRLQVTDTSPTDQYFRDPSTLRPVHVFKPCNNNGLSYETALSQWGDIVASDELFHSAMIGFGHYLQTYKRVQRQRVRNWHKDHGWLYKLAWAELFMAYLLVTLLKCYFQTPYFVFWHGLLYFIQLF